MLTQKSIAIMQQSQKRNKIRAYNSHKRKLIEKMNLTQIRARNYRNLNAIVLTEESVNHAYAKAVLGIYLYSKGEEFISEFKFSNGKADVFCPHSSIFIEVEKNGHREQKKEDKLKKYREALNNGLINDVYIIPLEKFSFDFVKDLKMLDETLWL